MASGSGSNSQSAIAQKTWEMANQITPEEEVYKFDRNQLDDVFLKIQDEHSRWKFKMKIQYEHSR